ncbi:ATP-binding cassette domain-containing protein [Erwinia sp. CPCC 100877]|nr:ATP-binding cassette domain-containing protein [Erwinia sp. CPCC 100877]
MLEEREISIQTDSIRIAYEGKQIVDKLTLAIPKGKITAIIGPNGSGKSTILKALGRILKPKQGRIFLNGVDLHQIKTKECAKQLAILPQSPQAIAQLTVEDLISYGRYPHKKGIGRLTAADWEVIEWAMTVTRLTDIRQAEVNALSGGQRQRVWIAMALAQKTELILLDEPTTYLDLSYQLELLQLLAHLNADYQQTIVMVLHDLNLAARFSDYMIAVHEGKVNCHGSPCEVLTPETLAAVFQIDAEVIQNPRTGTPMCVTYDLLPE